MTDTTDTTEDLPGGFSGLLLTFGEGCTVDTLNHIFPEWRVELTLRAGTRIEGELLGAVEIDGEAALALHPVYEDSDEIDLRLTETVLFDAVIGIHIY